MTTMEEALQGIRTFLESKTCYDILPESFRLIVFDNKLSITKSLQALVTNGVVSAPLYDSTTQRFDGMFTLADVVHLIQYYYLTAHEYENVVEEVEKFQLGMLREIEQAISVPPPPRIFVHPDQPLADACAALVRTHARRLPLVDRDENTGKETIVSVLTQYRVLKFIAINCQHNCASLNQPIGSLGIGTYVSWYDSPPTGTTGTGSTALGTVNAAPPSPNPGFSRRHSRSSSAVGISTLSPQPTQLGFPSAPSSPRPPSTPGSGVDMTTYSPVATATMQTSVFDVVHVFSERGISAIPVLDSDGRVLNLYETVDVVDLIRHNAYQVLDSTIEVALQQRSPDFPGVITCTPNDTLASILAYIRERRCHRLVIVEPEEIIRNGVPRKKGALVGLLSLSDVLRFLVGYENLRGLEVEGLAIHGLASKETTAPGQTTAFKKMPLNGEERRLEVESEESESSEG